MRDNSTDRSERSNDRLVRDRRRFLRGIGATGTVGVLAGCLGGEDENGTENGDENGNEPEPEPAFFEVSDLLPGDASETRGSTVEISAEITNTGDETTTQDVALTLAGNDEGTESLELPGGETDSVFFGEFDTAEFTTGDYEYEVTTDDDSASATLTVEGALGDDPDALLSLDDTEFGPGTQTVSGSLDNPYAVALENGEVALDAPDDWEITAEGDTSFASLEALGSQDVEWEVTVPDDAEGDYEFTVTASYTSADEEADVSDTISVTVDIWANVEFEEILHFEDFYDGIEDRGDAGGPGGEWDHYEADLSAFLPADVVQLRFEDAYTDDGFGPSVQETVVTVDGDDVHTIEAATEAEDAYLHEDNSLIDDNSSEDDEWRFADGNADHYWIYQFDVPDDAGDLAVTIEMRNGFRVLARAV